jgi:hypothetical protein
MQPGGAREEHVVERLSAGRVRTRIGIGAAGLVGFVVVAALIALQLAPRSPGSAGGSFGQPASPSVAAPTPSSSEALAHFDEHGLAFDYPASWKMATSGQNMRYITILDFLGTGSGLATCQAVTPGPSDLFISGTDCRTDMNVGPGQVEVQLSFGDGPPHGPIDPSAPYGIGIAGTYVVVGGLPAIFSEDSQTGSDATTTLHWTLSVPDSTMSLYDVEARMEEPGLDQARAQVGALVASIRYDPPPVLLDPSDAQRALAVGLEAAAQKDPGLACFPRIAGASATATVTVMAGQAQLSKPLSVTCSTAIEPVAMWLWRLTLTESWAAASDRSAGTLTMTIWLSADGTPQWSSRAPEDASTIPYAQ